MLRLVDLWLSVPLSASRRFFDQGITAGIVVLLLFSLPLQTLATTFTASGFSQEIIASGLNIPTAFTFLPDGRILIAEKDGIVRVVKDGQLLSQPFINLRTRVNAYGDRGLVAIAADPNFATNKYVYLMYTYENNASQPDGAKTGRLSRVTAVGDVASPSSEVVILGRSVGESCKNFAVGTDCIPHDAAEHIGGDIKFASDGTMFVSIGESAPSSTVHNDALRAQDLNSLAGKIVRITTSGQGLPNNPFWTGNANHIRSKVWNYGLRNPFRLNVRPGTDIPYIGDVGWRSWEEINVGLAGANLGWPCYEGNGRQAGYEPKPVCQQLYSQGTVRPPLVAYPRIRLEGSEGSAAVGGLFYTGVAYPAKYRDAYFYADFGQGWIRYLKVTTSDTLVSGSIQDFALGADGPVALDVGRDGNLYYIAISTGELRRIRYGSGNTPPTAVAAATPTAGLAPLTVRFSSVGSNDPDGDPLQYRWDFGDGSSSTIANPSHTYTINGIFLARLTVTDGRGGTGTATASIVVGNRPPNATISKPLSLLQYKVGDVIAYAGSATDPEQGTLTGIALSWQVVLHHCPEDGCHEHPFRSSTGASGSFTIPDHGDDTFFEIILTAKDSGGLTSTKSVTLQPQTVEVTLSTQPSGLQVVYDGTSATAPLTRTSIVGSTHTIYTPSPQGTRAFVSWSDGGAQQHGIKLGSTNAVYTAVFNQSGTGGGLKDLTQLGTIIARVTRPTGGGNKNPEIIRDDDKPLLGSTALLRQYDTWDGDNIASEDWIGYQYSSTQTFSRVVFQEGMHFGDGGWFKTVTVQVRQNGVWKTVTGLQTVPLYPATNDGQSHETYTFDFNAVSGDGIRLHGAPGGSDAYISVGELEVFGPNPIRDLTQLGTIIARVTQPTGGGNKNLAVIRDGDNPPVGSTDLLRQYDTFDGKNAASEDWIGYQYASTQTFSRVVFQEGVHFGNGGWFKTLTVQVRRNGVWQAVSGLRTTPAYPGINDGQSYQTYTLEFNPISGEAIRLYGTPGGQWTFISVGELGVFGQ